ncbi:hypothetical protein Y032_0172g367 [Ancylostoma ceylanicum]|uniref:Uncharacterized protein n=1 Tax=Ancylostoma ceylanicum TaxID=53326 RepID=A0A016SV43_9BILA|nr:hypothetical protein Y032_0172g367 [Ancylostoma ceylanicum]
MVHKLLISPESHISAKLFTLVPSRTRGGNRKVFYQRGRTKLRMHSFAIRACSDYLKLTKDFAISSPFGQFKRVMAKKVLGP